ncbi:Collagen alpha-1(XXV) chain CLAC-P Collagen-like Alzheimer amyloid plaque component [Channa argus]|uniref:Collagen alpha-1(XXV) chain CLAC-P Collagen-like Alzheimer amyloid plaque component n=1 Tax=Channa argus TaxID=215402 RepID=A0A6G1Q6V8_CHAAH|nr:Collagen alpha-1(XXV) chain CLAC-P Collagen-like Alzheimer amyloid plaque component [Channa argus]
METAEARGASMCAEKMEKEVAPQKRQRCRTTVLSIISSLCSVASIAFCIHLSLSTADIKERVMDLESVNGEHTYIRAPGYSMDEFNSLIQQRVDELLSQHSYENYVKIRTARQASPECNCPPGRRLPSGLISNKRAQAKVNMGGSGETTSLVRTRTANALTDLVSDK